jgi:hypothetical protein
MHPRAKVTGVLNEQKKLLYLAVIGVMKVSVLLDAGDAKKKGSAGAEPFCC